ncbi:hypothetical protein NUSPORA_00099 [Nucleospora cyclopteri]
MFLIRNLPPFCAFYLFKPSMLIFKIKLIITVLICFVHHIKLIFYSSKPDVLSLKERYNELYDKMRIEKLENLKIIINNYEMLVETNQLDKNVDIFSLNDDSISNIVSTMQIMHTNIPKYFSLKMHVCVFGPFLIPIITTLIVKG